MLRKYLSKITRDGKDFYYADFGYEKHGKTSFRLWISNKLIQETEDGDPVIEFPMVNAELHITEKGNTVLKPKRGTNVFAISSLAGYRGGSEIKIITEKEYEIKYYQEYHSPNGNLGISEKALVSVEQNYIEYEIKRWGRLYGAPAEYKMRQNITGEEFEIPSDIEDIAKELE